MIPTQDLVNLHSEIAQRLEGLVKPQDADRKVRWLKQQHRTPKLRFLGIITNEVRRLLRSYRRRFEQLWLKEKFSLAELFYDSWIFEQAVFGDALIELATESLTPDKFDLLDDVADHFHNWATVDWLCLRVLQPLLLRHRAETLELLNAWNHSENIWKKRASVVAFVRRLGSSGEFTDIVLEFCDNIVFDEEDLVQKGVGWALKDNLPGAKERVLQYIKSLRQRGVSSTIVLYAIRDLKGPERETILRVKP